MYKLSQWTVPFNLGFVFSLLAGNTCRNHGFYSVSYIERLSLRSGGGIMIFYGGCLMIYTVFLCFCYEGNEKSTVCLNNLYFLILRKDMKGGGEG